jgi:uncharacterized membrane protein
MLAAALVLWLLVSSGLLLVAFGILFNRRRSYQWLCFILLLYFIHTVIALFAHQHPDSKLFNDLWVLYLRLGLIIVCFIAAMMTARWAIPVPRKSQP